MEVAVDGDVAVVTCTENILTGVPGGRRATAAAAALVGGRVVATNVFRRTPDGWRLWVHHASPVLARTRGRRRTSDRPDRAARAERGGHHGVFAEERENGQTFVVDLVLELDTRAAAAATT